LEENKKETGFISQFGQIICDTGTHNNYNHVAYDIIMLLTYCVCKSNLQGWTVTAGILV
jgi:hypothetical protein